MTKLLFLCLLLSACANKPCREPTSPLGAAPIEKPSGKPAVNPNRLWVAKPDGSAQCEENSGSGPEKMKVDLLKGIPVYDMSSKDDGLMRTQMCGNETGKHNVYLIDKKNLEKVKALGFKEWQ